MPVTAKLSRKFYEKLGDEVANELVEWFNVVDAAYRTDLRELNELNFNRFRAELRGSVAELRGELAQFRGEMEGRLARFEADIDRRLAELETRLTRRLFGFWVAQAATTVALVFAVVKLVR